MTPSLKHLWAGDWRAESERARRAREGENPFAAGPEAPPEPRVEPATSVEQPAPRPRTLPRQSRANWAVAAIGLTAIAALLAVVLTLTGGSDNSSKSATVPERSYGSRLRGTHSSRAKRSRLCNRQSNGSQRRD